jgi:hypothetical protein
LISAAIGAGVAAVRKMTVAKTRLFRSLFFISFNGYFSRENENTTILEQKMHVEIRARPGRNPNRPQSLDHVRQETSLRNSVYGSGGPTLMR